MTFSASQISKARGCFRKWGWQYLEGIKQPQTAANTTGIVIHKMQEDYLVDGHAPPDLGEAAELFRLSLPYLPRPGLASVEQRRSHTLEDIEYLIIPDGYHYDWATRTIVLIDHKTSKHFPRFLLRKREQFLDDVQFLLYARVLLAMFHEALDVKATWIGYKVRDPNSDKKYTPKVYAEPLWFERDEIEQAFTRVVQPVARTLVQIHAKGLRAAQLPANVDHCVEYGGCWYLKQKICKPGEREMANVNVDDLFAQFEAHSAPTKPIEPKRDLINAPEAKSSVTGPLTPPQSGNTGAAQADPPPVARLGLEAWLPVDNKIESATNPYHMLDVLCDLGHRVTAFDALRTLLKASL